MAQAQPAFAPVLVVLVSESVIVFPVREVPCRQDSSPEDESRER
jgi:hypothetical protein